MVSKEEPCHGQCASEHRWTHTVMVTEDKSVELRMVVDKKHIGPILFLQDVSELALVIPYCGRCLVPFDRGALGLEPGIPDVRFGCELGQCVVVAEIGLKSRAQRVSLCTSDRSPRCVASDLRYCGLSTSEHRSYFILKIFTGSI